MNAVVDDFTVHGGQSNNPSNERCKGPFQALLTLCVYVDIVGVSNFVAALALFLLFRSTPASSQARR